MATIVEHIITISCDLEEIALTAESQMLIKRAIKETLASEEFDEQAEVSVTIVDKDEIRALNKLHRDKDKVTDVLSFIQYDEDGFVAYEDEAVFIGDIVICYQVAVEQAEEFGHSLERELAYLSCHSCLHLLGYDHIDADDKAEMREREEIVMKRLNLRLGESNS